MQGHDGMENSDDHLVLYEHNGVALGHCGEVRRFLTLHVRADD